MMVEAQKSRGLCYSATGVPERAREDLFFVIEYLLLKREAVPAIFVRARVRGGIHIARDIKRADHLLRT